MEKRYEKKKNVTLDNETGLEWQAGPAKPMKWDETIEYAKSLGDGWRLPTAYEVLELIDCPKTYPTTDLPNEEGKYYWSLSCITFTFNVQGIHFYYDSVDNYKKIYGVYACCVRKRKKKGKRIMK